MSEFVKQLRFHLVDKSECKHSIHGNYKRR